MKPAPFATIHGLLTGILLWLLHAPLRAEQFGLFTYRIDGKTVTITDYPEDAVGHVTVPSVIGGRPVTTLGEYAFAGCTSLTDVAMPAGVTWVGYGSFAGCTSLVAITIPDTVTHIGGGAFGGCSGLASVSIGMGVTTIENNAFERCTGLEGIEVSPLNPSFSSLDGVLFDKFRTILIKFPAKRIGPYAIPGTVLMIRGWSSAFEGCTGLTSVSIPGSVTWISGGAFEGCTGLTGFSVDAANPAYSSLDGVLFSKTRTALVRYPQGRAAASYAIPGTVTSISGDVFQGCTGLTSVAIPDTVTTIEGPAFQGCTGLASVSIPNGVTRIGERTFEGCTGLTSVSIPNSVAEIGHSAFEGCTGLASVAIPASVASIGYASFYGCTGLTGFSVDAANPAYSSLDGVLFFKSPFRLIQVPARKAGHYSIPNGVTEIGEGGLAFDHCPALTSVFIPVSFTSLTFPYKPVFQGCSSLASIEVDPLNPSFVGLDGVLFRKDQSSTDQLTLVRFPPGKTGAYFVPATTVSIGDFAFEGCAGLRAVMFMGDNPGGMFADAGPGFTLYYFRGSFGFTSPTWQGYPAVMIDRAVHPAAEWLLGYDLPYDTDLQDDVNGDGVNLLMAYALNLDPNLNLRASLPVPLLGAQDLSLSFHGIRPGITYAAETSTDLQHWTTDGVILSSPGADGRRTASIPRDGPARSLRLVLRK